MKARGFQGTARVVSEWATRRRERKRPLIRTFRRCHPPEQQRLMMMARDHLSKTDCLTVAAIESSVLALVETRNLIRRFHAMIRKRIETDLEPWIAKAGANLLASFAAGIAKFKTAVRAAITQPWSNGQTEGQVSKLKKARHQMYGTAKFDLVGVA
jgi:transposase